MTEPDILSFQNLAVENNNPLSAVTEFIFFASSVLENYDCT
jgi:hypothetical protein